MVIMSETELLRLLGKNLLKFSIVMLDRTNFLLNYRHHLPESPPDSGSEHPYSPADTQTSQISSVVGQQQSSHDFQNMAQTQVQNNHLHHAMIVATSQEGKYPIPISPTHKTMNSGSPNGNLPQIYTELKPSPLVHPNIYIPIHHLDASQQNLLDIGSDGHLMKAQDMGMHDDMMQNRLCRQNFPHISVELSNGMDSSSMVSPLINNQLVGAGNGQMEMDNSIECTNPNMGQVYTNLQPVAPSKKRKLSQDMIPHVKCEPGTNFLN